MVAEARNGLRREPAGRYESRLTGRQPNLQFAGEDGLVDGCIVASQLSQYFGVDTEMDDRQMYLATRYYPAALAGR